MGLPTAIVVLFALLAGFALGGIAITFAVALAIHRAARGPLSVVPRRIRESSGVALNMSGPLERAQEASGDAAGVSELPTYDAAELARAGRLERRTAPRAAVFGPYRPSTIGCRFCDWVRAKLKRAAPDPMLRPPGGTSQRSGGLKVSRTELL